MAMIELISDILIDEGDLSFSYIRAGGPGGQNVNKVSTAVQLRFDLNATEALSEDEKQRLKELCKSRINSDGMLLIEAHSYRTQEQNRLSALRRLGAFLDKAKTVQKARIPTKARRSAGGGGGSADSSRRREGKRIRLYDPELWGE